MNILLIEDNPGDARLVREMLKEAFGDVEIVNAERLSAGLSRLASQEFDAVLVDPGLPDSHGLETLTSLQKQFSHLPVVIMTGSQDEELGILAVKHGAQDYLVKGQVNSKLLARTLLYAIERKKTAAASKSKGMTVLLVEDNAGDARLVQEMLKETSGDFSLDVAERLSNGLRRLSLQEYDVVLLDLNLPDSRGLETMTSLQKQFSSLPLVVLTGANDEGLGVEAVKRGAQDFLVKGQVDSKLLARTLLYAIERKKTAAALKEQQQFLARLADLNPAVISVFDLTDAREVYSSKSSLAFLGYKPEEVKDPAGFAASLMYPGDYDRMVASSVELVKANDDRVRDIEVRAKAADGRWRWLQIFYVIFKRDRNGLPLQAMSVAQDITERKEAEQIKDEYRDGLARDTQSPDHHDRRSGNRDERRDSPRRGQVADRGRFERRPVPQSHSG